MNFKGFHPLLILVLCLMADANIHIQGKPIYDYVTVFLNIVGSVGLVAWYVIIVNTGRSAVEDRRPEMRLVKLSYLFTGIILLSMIALFALDYISPISVATESDIERGQAFTYARLYYLSIVLLVASYVVLTRNTAKILVSAEKGRLSFFQEYFKTFVLLIFPFVGAWFVNPRLQKLGTKNMQRK